MVKQLEHYELTERIKQVNGATWWRGWDSKLERDVSIWTIPATDPRVLKLRASAAAAANLHDPRVLRVLDVVGDENLFGVISEWIHGVTIAERVLGRAPLADAEQIIQSLIDCLAVAHGQQIHHGALTADDVVLTSSGIRVRGFGIASVINEPFGITEDQADFSAVGAIGYAAVTATWPLLTNCSLPAAPTAAGLVALPSQLTPKLPNCWDNLAHLTLPTVNPNLNLARPIIELNNVFTAPKSKFINLPTIDLPPSTISRSGLIAAVATIASLLIVGSVLVFSSLSTSPTANSLEDNQTGTDLRNELLPVAQVSVIDNENEPKLIPAGTVFSVAAGQAIQIQLRERRTVQRIEIDLTVAGVNLLAQVTDAAITEKSDVGKLGEISEAASTAIVFGPRFVTGNFLTIWVEVPGGGNVQISRVAAYGTPS